METGVLTHLSRSDGLQSFHREIPHICVRVIFLRFQHGHDLLVNHLLALWAIAEGCRQDLHGLRYIEANIRNRVLCELKQNVNDVGADDVDRQDWRDSLERR